MKNKIAPCLWFDGKAEEAGDFYTSLFNDSRVLAQSQVVNEIEVGDQKIILLNGGPDHQPNPSISLFYCCESDSEIQRIWDAFSKEGNVLMPLDEYPWSKRYGWVNDKYGVSWQFSLGSMKDVGQKVTPCLMFVGDQYGRAEEAINHYFSIFNNTKLDGIARYGSDQAPEEEGRVMHGQAALNGQKFMFMDSAQQHNFQFSEGVSLTIYCETQEEIDHYWDKLTDEGEESMCGWLKDKFGVSWQVIPTILGELMSDPDKAGKTAAAFMDMRKIDIEQIVQAAQG